MSGIFARASDEVLLAPTGPLSDVEHNLIPVCAGGHFQTEVKRRLHLHGGCGAVSWDPA